MMASPIAQKPDLCPTCERPRFICAGGFNCAMTALERTRKERDEARHANETLVRWKGEIDSHLIATGVDFPADYDQSPKWAIHKLIECSQRDGVYAGRMRDAVIELLDSSSEDVRGIRMVSSRAWEALREAKNNGGKVSASTGHGGGCARDGTEASQATCAEYPTTTDREAPALAPHESGDRLQRGPPNAEVLTDQVRPSCIYRAGCKSVHRCTVEGCCMGRTRPDDALTGLKRAAQCPRCQYGAEICTCAAPSSLPITKE